MASNDHRYMATGKWQKKRSTKSTPIVYTLFRLFSLVFDHFCTFSLVFALFGLPFFAIRFRTFFAPFAYCRLAAAI